VGLKFKQLAVAAPDAGICCVFWSVFVYFVQLTKIYHPALGTTLLKVYFVTKSAGVEPSVLTTLRSLALT
jgi:hypothetical protein